jgi:hypothetical protein
LEKGNELFIDTTYLLPFLQVPIRIKGFTLSDFREFIANLSRVHVSELSVYEAKAKLLRLSKIHRGYGRVLRAFGENLNVLRTDEKFLFRSYTGEADQRFNQLTTVAKRLDAFDLIILSEASTVGKLLTEDTNILSFRDSDQFAETPPFNSMEIKSWKDVKSSQLSGL